jgi:hypothetical protein
MPSIDAPLFVKHALTPDGAASTDPTSHTPRIIKANRRDIK